MINVLIWGAGGRMGKRLIKLLMHKSDMQVVAAIETKNHPGINKSITKFHGFPESLINLTIDYNPPDTDSRGLVIDFSLPGGPEKATLWAVKHGWALVSGTTAITNQDKQAMTSAAKSIPLMYASNYSVGIQLLMHLVSQAGAALPENFDSTICETHHCAKQDRPSGTALSFKEKLIKNNSRRNIDIASLRGGSIVGEHEIRFISEMEDIVFSHKALNRDVFADGAINAGRWLIEQDPGFYALADMLELK